MEKKKKRNRYSLEDKMKALIVLRENNYNYRLTSKETGVAAVTLENWYCKHKKDLENISVTKAIAEKAEIDATRLKTKFLEKHYASLSDLTELAVTRIKQLIPKEKRLSSVTDALKVLLDYSTKLSDSDEEKGKTEINFIQQTINQLNNIGNKDH